MFTAQIQATSKARKARFLTVEFIVASGIPTMYIDGERYLVIETTSNDDFGIGRSFVLVKRDGTEYKVFVATDINSKANWCDCEGFRRHGYCKHIDALRYLILMGVIDERPAPVIEQGQPEPQDLFEPEEMGLFC